MQATVIGVTRMSGVSKESKSKYDMARALILNPISPFENENFKREGSGFEVLEIEMDIAALPLFSGVKFPLSCELDIQQRVSFGKLNSYISGLKTPAKVA